jgi:hypothetical protein
MNVFNVIHYMEYVSDEVISTHRTIQGAAIAAYKHAIRAYRAHNQYTEDPETQWDDGCPFWKWPDNLVKVKMEVLQS